MRSRVPVSNSTDRAPRAQPRSPPRIANLLSQLRAAVYAKVDAPSRSSDVIFEIASLSHLNLDKRLCDPVFSDNSLAEMVAITAKQRLRVENDSCLLAASVLIHDVQQGWSQASGVVQHATRSLHGAVTHVWGGHSVRRRLIVKSCPPPPSTPPSPSSLVPRTHRCCGDAELFACATVV